MSAAQQPELDFDTAPVAAVDEARLHELLATLAAAPGEGWMTRRALEAHGFDERELRELVELDDAGRVFSFPGSPGYKLFARVTHAEFDRCAALRSQGRRMLARWLRYQRQWHRRGEVA